MGNQTQQKSADNERKGNRRPGAGTNGGTQITRVKPSTPPPMDEAVRSFQEMERISAKLYYYLDQIDQLYASFWTEWESFVPPNVTEDVCEDKLRHAIQNVHALAMDHHHQTEESLKALNKQLSVASIAVSLLAVLITEWGGGEQVR